MIIPKQIEDELRRLIPSVKQVAVETSTYDMHNELISFDFQAEFTDGSWLTAENVVITRLTV